MTEVRFESGRVFHIENDDCAYWILMSAGDHPTEEELRKSLIVSYIDMGGCKAGADYLKQLRQKQEKIRVDYRIMEDCLFKDVETFGEAGVAESIAHFHYTMFYIENGLCPPDGPLPWGDFD